MPRAARNIYEQQYQTAQFVATYDRSVCVVLNDIGAVTYFNEVDLIDLVGLGSQAVMRYRLERTLVQLPVVGRWFRRDGAAPPIFPLGDLHGDIAMVYDAWSEGRIPSAWVKLVEWEISGNVVCGDPVVSVYAMRSELVPELTEALECYRPTMPQTVTWRWFVPD